MAAFGKSHICTSKHEDLEVGHENIATTQIYDHRKTGRTKVFDVQGGILTVQGASLISLIRPTEFRPGSCRPDSLPQNLAWRN